MINQEWTNEAKRTNIWYVPDTFCEVQSWELQRRLLRWMTFRSSVTSLVQEPKCEICLNCSWSQIHETVVEHFSEMCLIDWNRSVTWKQFSPFITHIFVIVMTCFGTEQSWTQIVNSNISFLQSRKGEGNNTKQRHTELRSLASLSPTALFVVCGCSMWLFVVPYSHLCSRGLSQTTPTECNDVNWGKRRQQQ